MSFNVESTFKVSNSLFSKKGAVKAEAIEEEIETPDESANAAAMDFDDLDDIDIDRICPYCDDDMSINSNTDNRRYFERHVKLCKQYHNLIIDKRQCSKCEKSFQSHGHVLSHMDKCRGSKICHHCNQEQSKSQTQAQFIKHLELCEKNREQIHYVNFRTCFPD